jgi:hypothetical protein
MKHLPREDVLFLQTDPLLLYSFSHPKLAHSVIKRMINDIKIILSKKLLYHLMGLFTYLATPLKIICHFTNLLT